MVLGAVSIISTAFVFTRGTFQLVQIGAAGLVVALVLGLLAVLAGWWDEPTLLIAIGLVPRPEMAQETAYETD